MAYGDVPAFFETLRAREGIASRALELTILAAARPSEVLGATWNDVNLGAQTWTVPKERVKRRR
jgi:integrase